MQNFTTSKDAQIIEVSGLVQTESVQGAALKNGDSLASGTVLTFSQGSEITLAFADGTEQKITGEVESTLATDDQTTQQLSGSIIAEAQSQTVNPAIPDNLQDDINAIQALIESGDDIELPDTAAAGVTGNEGTDFVTLDRDGNELLASAGVDTAELNNALGAADVTVVDPLTPVNALPDAVDDTFSIDENTELAGALIGNDDLGDEATTVTSFDSASVNGASVTVDANGNFTYTPVADFVGADTFTYTITDADGDTSTATATVNVANVNKLPDAVDDTFAMDENTGLTGTLLGNDDLGDQDTTVTGFDGTSANGAAVTVDADGNFTYTPVTDFVGADTFTYTITDADGDTSTATVTVNVANVNKLPDAVDDTFTIDENTSLTGAVLGNDDLGDEDTSVTSFDGTSANGATVTVDADGNFTYTPVDDFVGADTFTYTITDADGDTSTATVTVNVANVNKLPDAVDDSFTIDENTSLTGAVLGNDDLGDEDTSVTSFDGTSANGATVTVDADGNFTYTPVADFVGPDTFTYTITDADGDTSTATVTINVENVNNLPEAVDDNFNTNQNAGITGTLLGNDDLGDQVTTVTGFDSSSANGGSVSVNAGGNFSYTPATNFVGTDTFTYTITDADGDTSTATVTVVVNAPDINNLPDAVDDNFNGNENTLLEGTLLGNDDLGDQLTTVTGFDSASTNGGTVTVDAAGNFTYTPAIDFVGADTFTYTITDADGDTSTATVTITVSAPENIPPVAEDDSFSLSEGDSVSGNVITNLAGADSDGGDGAALSVTQVVVNGIATNVAAVGSTDVAIEGGTLSISADGSFTYTNSEGFDFDPLNPSPQPSFEYTLSDGTDTDTANVSITINDSAPVANDDVKTIVLEGDAVDGAQSVTVSGNIIAAGTAGDVADTSADGTVTLMSVEGQTFVDSVTPIVITKDFGELSILSSGAYSYVSTAGVTIPDAAVTDIFSYVIEDGDGNQSESDTATLTINLTPNSINIPPVAADDSFSLSEGDSVSGNVITNEDDADGVVDTDGGDGAALSVTQVVVNGIATNVAAVGSTDVAIEGGTLNISADGSFTYTNSDGFDFDPLNPSTQPSFEYTLSDGTDTDTANVSITINDSAPVANDDANFIVLEGDAINGAASVTVSGNIIAAGTAGDVADTSADGTVTLVSVEGQTFVDSVTPIVITKDFGELSILSSGAYSYVSTAGVTIPANAVTDTFTYVIEDGDVNQNESDTATLTINLTPNLLNIPPVAENDSFSVNEGLSVSGNVITHDDDNDGVVDTDGGDGGALEVTQVNGVNLVFDATTGDATFTVIDGVFTALTPAEVLLLDDSVFTGTNDNGILTINADGDFTYESKGFLAGSPAPAFTYTLSDGTDTDTARVTITVETNAPVANDDSSGFDFSPDKTITVQGNVSGLGRGSSGDVRDNFGADGSGSPAVIQVEYMGVVYSLGVSNSSGNPIEIVTDFGSLFIDNMGTYQFVEKDGLTLEEITADDIPTNSDGNLALDFTYTIQDGDTLNSETSSADLVIEIRVPAVTPDTLSHDIDFDKTSGTIDTGSASKARIVVDDASKDESPETDNLSDILVDAQSDGLEKYLTMMMGEDEGSKDNTELSVALKDFQVDDAIVLKKGEVEAEPVTNGLLADGAIIISDAAAANSVPIAELDSSELL